MRHTHRALDNLNIPAAASLSLRICSATRQRFTVSSQMGRENNDGTDDTTDDVKTSPRDLQIDDVGDESVDHFSIFKADFPRNAGLSRSRSEPAALRMNLSFCGCGFLGIYHLGVATALAKHGSGLLLNVQRYCGASAGALIASALAVKGPDTEILEECRKFCLQLAADTSRKKLGVLTPGQSLMKPLENFLCELLPEDAHRIATGRLYISVTDLKSRKNRLVSQYDSREELIQYLLGSSYIPFVTGNKAVRIQNRRFIDGGMTDNLPSPPDGRTILVSPFSGKQDICPEDKQGKGMFMRVNRQDFQLNLSNAKRGFHAFFPPSVAFLDKYFEKGHRDAVRFLRKEGMYRPESVPAMPVQKKEEKTGLNNNAVFTTADSIQFETIV